MSFVVAQGMVIEGLDPYRVSSSVSRSALKSTFETLIDRENNLSPSLAKSWESVGDEGWMVHLREDVRFQDGQSFNGESVEFSYRRFVDPQLGNVLYRSLEKVTEVRVEAEHRVFFKTDGPFPAFPYALGRMPVLPLSADSSDFWESPVGTGPFVIEKWRPGGDLTMVANHNYWGGKPALHSVRWITVEDPQERIEKVVNGEVHLAAGLPPWILDNIPGSLPIVRQRNALSTAIVLNCADTALQQGQLRQALNYGVDRERIISDTLRGAAYRLDGPIGPSYLGYDPNPGYDYHPQTATRIVEELGLKGYQLTIAVPKARYPMGLNVSQEVAKDLSRIGLKATTEEIPWQEFSSRLIHKRHQAYFFQVSTMSSDRLLPGEFSSKLKSLGWQHYQNKEVDSLLDEAIRHMDDAKRAQIYKQAYRLLQADPPWIFLYNEEDIYALSPRVTGWQPLPNGFVSLAGTQLN